LKASSVSSALKRLAGIVVDVVEIGSGQRPSVYRTKPSISAPHRTAAKYPLKSSDELLDG
jgi:hypothetical protein